MRLRRSLPAVLALAASLHPAAARAVPHPSAPSCPVFPADNVWHADVSALPVHPKSEAWLASMGGPGVNLHPDFGPSGTAQPYGIPYDVVGAGHSKVSIDFDYADESDPGPYPFGPDITIEDGSDRHALMLHRDECVLYELFDARWNGGNPTAGSGAIWNLRSNALRPATWTSADAAGFPIFVGLIRRDEIAAGVIDHAIRMTASRTRRQFIWPARHQAGESDDPNLPPMGAWFRLRAGFDVSGFHPETRVILRAMQRHGMALADNGSDWYFGGASESGWPEAVLDELKSIEARHFEAVDISPLMIDPDSARISQGTATTVTARLGRTRSSPGRRVRIAGRLEPAITAAEVTLQRRRDGAWRSVRSRAVAADGTFAFRVRPRREGVFRYRVRFAGDAGHLPDVSPVLRLTVRFA